MKTPYSIAWKSALAILILAASPVHALSRTLERDNFGPSFKVFELKSDTNVSNRRLCLRALDQMTPSQTTSTGGEPLLKTKVIDKDLVVMIEYSPPRRFQKIEYKIDMPSGVTRVLFGTNKKEIWPQDEFYSSDEYHAMAVALKQFKVDNPEARIDEYFWGICPATSTEKKRDSLCVTFGTFDPKDANSITYEVEKLTNTAHCVKGDEFAKSFRLRSNDQ